MNLITIENPKEDETKPIINGIIEYGLSQVQNKLPRSWAFHAKDENIIVGGAIGRDHFSQFYLDHIWVREEFRSKGLGSHIHEQILDCASSCGCRRIQLNTLNKRAVDFYTKLGYSTLAIIEEYVDGFDLYYMAKEI
ncbi:GNAT family N-acetyltransferase [Thiothrix unzii]|jgi:ribosomal protein S18 acetylase RimI-like enzyme|uniref:GNAT family N-acetyltransferase n=1 Tax=Thiothrix unzii TaxID=111769 RepID=UPI002A35CEA4|nr:GNAT family N-acetyltransferase [Thiothrix unzii]MDX9990270.1 GNAT family N-acetyltransferase [Thiothrix unzii]